MSLSCRPQTKTTGRASKTFSRWFSSWFYKKEPCLPKPRWGCSVGAARAAGFFNLPICSESSDDNRKHIALNVRQA